jgi:hypothetical protein
MKTKIEKGEINVSKRLVTEDQMYIRNRIQISSLRMCTKPQELRFI